MKELVFKRRGDFYETSGPDALEAANALNVVVTKHSNGSRTLAIPAHCWSEWMIELGRAGFDVVNPDRSRSWEKSQT